jgi:hypothetical protein
MARAILDRYRFELENENPQGVAEILNLSASVAALNEDQERFLEYSKGYAKAALSALEEPSEAMVEAGEALQSRPPALATHSSRIFNAMIKAAKGEE